ncbi:MAG: hypothetical protein A2V88_07685 [Elusimicrobia bacterium RBG_16_66_12]|nr:MAG: hypothetical protein A2V88_07685 [Elusimicrobia bacterium RBG_16_66_12]
MQTSTQSRLEQAIRARSAVVSVVGLGYVGLPTAVSFAQAGFATIGVDLDAGKVAKINRGESYLPDVPSDVLRALVAALHTSGRPQLLASAGYEALAGADAALICVPTPSTANKEPDTRHIVSAAEGIARQMRAGRLVVLRSTSYPGTTRELVAGALQRAGGILGLDSFVAFAPERIDPGRSDPLPSEIPVVIGGCDAESTQLAVLLFAQVVERVVPVSSAEAAEMVKLLENVFRNVNIALVNQLAMLCDRMGLNVWEIIDAAATKPFGFMKFTPGPGVGGHCIPVDPYYLAWKAREYDFHMDFIELAARVNDEMPYFVVNKIVEALGRMGAGGGARVLVVGVTFKRDVPDERSSPAVKIIELLRRRGYAVGYHDPYVPTLRLNEDLLSSQPLTPDVLRSHDCVVIATDHTAIDYSFLVEHARCVVDTRNATRSVAHGAERIIKL